MPAQGLSLCELVRTSAMYSPARRASTLPHSTGPSPSGRTFGSDRRRRSSGGDPGPFALTPFLSVESEEVGLSPFLRPLAQTARAVFPQAAFLCDRLRCPGSFDPPASADAVRVSSMAAQGLSLCELVRTSAMYSPARRSSTLPHSTGPSPSGRSFGSDRRHCSSGSDPGPFALTPFLSTSPRSDSWHRFSRNFACAYIRPYHRGLQAGLCVACFSPFRLRVSHD